MGTYLSRTAGKPSEPTISRDSSDYPTGLKTLEVPLSPTVDIVFVHGLGGNRETSWSHTQTGVCWPKDFLPHDIPSARILSWGYDSDIIRFFKMTSSNKLRNHAESFAFALANHREDCPGRPIIFICHSLGGLICEQALLCCRSSNEKRMKSVLDCTGAVIFMGTPHSGSHLANWGGTLAKLVSKFHTANPALLDVLEPGSQLLVNLQTDFQQLLLNPSRHISVFCFYEEYAVSGFGMIVPYESAIMEQYERAGIGANHMDMAKFGTRNDSGYVSVLKLLQSWMKDFQASAAEKDRSKHKESERFPRAGTGKVINSRVSGGQVYMGDINHCGSGNIAFHAG
ncbi:hypothetical protein IFR05_007326 [Cadophora sp. M221]|nr:hypothetical protein IFR05_007326 [Cadophora sp. M221]